MVAHSIIAATREDCIAEILINAPEGYELRTREIMEAYCAGKPFKILPCGRTRQESVRIIAAAAEHSKLILHEAARPFIDSEMLRELIEVPSDTAGYCSAIPFSMCRVDPSTGLLLENVPRDEIYNIQLPQKFLTRQLMEAHDKALAQGRQYTEDTVLVAEMLGIPVQTLNGRSRNIKVTTPEDFKIAESIFRGVKNQ